MKIELGHIVIDSTGTKWKATRETRHHCNPDVAIFTLHRIADQVAGQCSQSGGVISVGKAREGASRLHAMSSHAEIKAIPDHAICRFKDGNKWCAVFGNFKNLVESVAGFGDTSVEAVQELWRLHKEELISEAQQ